MWLKERLGTLMRLASFKTSKGASYRAVTDKGIVDLGKRIGNKYADLKALIAAGALAEAKKLATEKPDLQESEIEWLPVIPNPGKIVCVASITRSTAWRPDGTRPSTRRSSSASPNRRWGTN